jgi:hypothetical protein
VLSPHLSSAPRPSLAGRVLGNLLALAAVVCIGIGSADAVSERPRDMFGWFGLSFFLLIVVPSLCYAVRPGLLGGPVSWYIAFAYRSLEGAYPRLLALLVTWMGLCLSGLFWLFGYVDALRQNSLQEAAVVVCDLLLMFVPPFIAATLFARRLRRRSV